jgi:hypothetical protein
MEPEIEATLTHFLHENANVFAWKPSDMPSILREIARHSFSVKLEAKLVQQHLHHFEAEGN